MRLLIPYAKLTEAEINEIIAEKERQDRRTEKSKDSLDARKESIPASAGKDSVMSDHAETIEQLQDKLQEVDQDEKALATLTVAKDLPYSVYVFNQYASRAHR